MRERTREHVTASCPKCSGEGQVWKLRGATARAAFGGSPQPGLPELARASLSSWQPEGLLPQQRGWDLSMDCDRRSRDLSKYVRLLAPRPAPPAPPGDRADPEGVCGMGAPARQGHSAA